jgi:DEAD/DEAH box helicase domain-containing protein
VAPIVRGPINAPLFGKAIDVQTLLSSAPDAVVVEIADSADGAALGFGRRLRRALEAQSDDLLRTAGTDEFKQIVYSDRYVFSPLSALFAAELVGAFASSADAELIVRTRRASKSVHATPPSQVQHDWTTQSDRAAVLRTLLARHSQRARVNLDDATPHRRTLVLKTEAGALELTLDQGVGAWQPVERYRFDFGRRPEDQVETLLKTLIRVTNAASGTFVVIRKLP